MAFGTDHAMPIVLDRKAMNVWLNPKETSVDALIALLHTLPKADFDMYPVSPLVASTALESPDCIAELHPDSPLVKV